VDEGSVDVPELSGPFKNISESTGNGIECTESPRVILVDFGFPPFVVSGEADKNDGSFLPLPLLQIIVSSFFVIAQSRSSCFMTAQPIEEQSPPDSEV